MGISGDILKTNHINIHATFHGKKGELLLSQVSCSSNLYIVISKRVQ